MQSAGKVPGFDLNYEQTVGKLITMPPGKKLTLFELISKPMIFF